MTAENFIYWLQGKLEIGDTKSLNESEVQVIKDHIALVLKKETPKREPLQIPIIADPKLLPGEIKIVTQPAIGPYIGNVCLGCGKAQCSGTGLGCRSLIATC